MENCPHCHRKLLSHASLNCNWCGEAIDDPAYASHAKAEQEAFLAHEEERIALEQQRIATMRDQNNWAMATGRARYGVFGSARRGSSSFLGNLFNRAPISPPDPVLDPLPPAAAAPRTAASAQEAPRLAAGLGEDLPRPSARPNNAKQPSRDDAKSAVETRFSDLDFNDKP